MKSARDRPDQRPAKAPGADMSRKLQKIVTEIKESGQANLTRLTVLKKWFEAPHRVLSFGMFIAGQALRHAPEATGEAAEMFRKAYDLLADVDILDPGIPRADATGLHDRLKAFQNKYRQVPWTSVRLIHNHNLFLVESGLDLYLRHGNSPADSYRLAAAYCEHYNSRYGNGLNGPSAQRIEEIAGFVRVVEAYEPTGPAHEGRPVWTVDQIAAASREE